jgi:hypothetical protein
MQSVPKSCYKRECNNPPAWQGYVMFWITTPWPSYGEARASVLACEHHRDAAAIADVVTDDLWSQITETLRSFGAGLPERSEAEVEFRPIAAPGRGDLTPPVATGQKS